VVKGIKEGLPGVFALRIRDPSKVIGAPVMKNMLLDAADADGHEAWTSSLEAVTVISRLPTVLLQSEPTAPVVVTMNWEGAVVAVTVGNAHARFWTCLLAHSLSTLPGIPFSGCTVGADGCGTCCGITGERRISINRPPTGV
jgi:hypothetical protein